MDEPWTEDVVARKLINPNYCLTYPPVVTEEKWIEANAKLIPWIASRSTPGSPAASLPFGQSCKLKCAPTTFQRIDVFHYT
jgi:hypothetical protein